MDDNKMKFLPGVPAETEWVMEVYNYDGETEIKMHVAWKTPNATQRTALQQQGLAYFAKLDELVAKSGIVNGHADELAFIAEIDETRSAWCEIIKSWFVRTVGVDYSIDDMLQWDNYLFALSVSLLGVAKGYRVKNSLTLGMHGSPDTIDPANPSNPPSLSTTI